MRNRATNELVRGVRLITNLAVDGVVAVAVGVGGGFLRESGTSGYMGSIALFEDSHARTTRQGPTCTQTGIRS